ncbi:MAG TPA: hypothetical protein VFL57_16130 [Bryobacteraceae bacterium]|nr:hypothetical protein [Bryobacteraceae bacterium]
MRLAAALGSALLLFPAGAWQPARKVAELANPAITESSGIAPSVRNRGLYWTHNDSGRPLLFLFGPDGRDAGTWTVAGARNVDWEDIAVGPGPERGRGYIYIGDIGNNNRPRSELIIYRVPEPLASAAVRATERAIAVRFRYPDSPHDAEALLVHPKTGDIYIATKERGGEVPVYKLAAPHSPGNVRTLTPVGTVRLPNDVDISFLVGRITGGAISRDARRVVLCDYLRAYEALVPEGAAFDSVWKRRFHAIDVDVRKQGESITYSLDGRSLLLTSEGSPCPLFEAKRDRP